MAIAGGKIASGKWWSQIIKSMPSSFAYSTNSMDLIPQSTDIINCMPVCFA